MIVSLSPSVVGLRNLNGDLSIPSNSILKSDTGDTKIQREFLPRLAEGIHILTNSSLIE